MAKLTKGGRYAVVAIVGIIAFAAAYIYKDSGIFPQSVKESKVVAVEDLPPLEFDKNFAAAPAIPLPSTTPADIATTKIRAGIMGWNAQSGVLYANGGPVTTQGSLMEAQNINLELLSNNNCMEQGNQLLAFARDYAAGKTRSTKGYHMTAWMGDGVPALIAGVNNTIKEELGPEYILQAFYVGGSSYGEDKFMGPVEAKRDPQSLRGSLIVAVLRDGDWNIAMKFCSDNDIPVNSDPKTYDPDAVNWIATDDYIKAAEIYVNNQKEKRPMVRNGKTLQRDTLVGPTGLVTWTPGDRVAVEKRGGVVTLASTKDYTSQMPNTWIACKKWLEDNRETVEGFILAASQGGDQVKSHSSALRFASTVSYQVYKDENMKPEDWEKAFRGYTMTDAQGNRVEIGGSRVWNLADQAEYFGLNGGTNKYAAVYKTFGDITVESYPSELPSYPPVEEVLNLTFLTSVYNKYKNNVEVAGAASVPTFKASDRISSVVSSKAVSIEFVTGSATISPKSANILEDLARSFTVADNLLIEITGHTDNVGDPAMNKQLSIARAEAVKNWFLTKDRSLFLNRINSNGYGEEQPIADNSNAYGRQKNRRVEIKLGR